VAREVRTGSVRGPVSDAAVASEPLPASRGIALGGRASTPVTVLDVAVGFLSEGKEWVCGGHGPGSPSLPALCRDTFSHHCFFLPNLCTFRLLSLHITGKDSWAWPGLCLVGSAPLADTCEDARITGQRPWCHHPRNPDPCLVRSPTWRFILTDLTGRRRESCFVQLVWTFRKKILLKWLEKGFPYVLRIRRR